MYWKFADLNLKLWQIIGNWVRSDLGLCLKNGLLNCSTNLERGRG